MPLAARSLILTHRCSQPRTSSRGARVHSLYCRLYRRPRWWNRLRRRI